MFAAKTVFFALFLMSIGNSVWPLIPLHARPENLATKATFQLAFGMIVLLNCVWLAPQFQTHQLLLLGFAFMGAGVLFAETVFRTPRVAVSARQQNQGLLLGLGATAVLVGLAGVVFLHPPTEWDSRSIWYLHAKMIYFAKSAGPSAGWTLPELQFSHPDYPKLNALIASHLLDTFHDGWDPLLAKGSLWILALLMGLGSATLPISSAIGRACVLTTVLLLGRDRLWNGYMDAQCAAFAILGFLSCLPTKPSPGSTHPLTSAVLGLAFLTLSTQCKNEGILSVAVLCVGLLVAGVGPQTLRLFRAQRPSEQVRWITLGWVALAPFLLWSLRKAEWAIPNDLALLSPPFRARLGTRFARPEDLTLILQALILGPNQISILAPLCLFGLGLLRRLKPRVEAALCASAALYTLVMVVIYLGTYHDLSWHLGTSAQRVMLFPVVCCVICLILLRERWVLSQKAVESASLRDQH